MVHILRRGDVYHWRRRVPRELVCRIGRRELLKSLQTRHKPTALCRARELSTAADSLFTVIMNTPTLSAEQIDDLARQWFRQIVAQWETKTVVREKFQSLLSVGGTPLAPEAEASVLEGMRVRVQKALAENDLNPSVNIADALLRDAGLDIPDDSPEYKRLCLTVLRAQAEYFKLTAAWRNGNFGVAPTDPLFAASLLGSGAASAPQPKPKSNA